MLKQQDYKDTLVKYLEARDKFEKIHRTLERETASVKPILSDQSTWDLAKEIEEGINEYMSSMVKIKTARIKLSPTDGGGYWGTQDLYLHGSKEGLYRSHSQSNDANWDGIKSISGDKIRFEHNTLDFSPLRSNKYIHSEKVDKFLELVAKYHNWRKAFGFTNYSMRLEVSLKAVHLTAKIDDDSWTISFIGADEISSSNVQDYEWLNASWGTKELKLFILHYDEVMKTLDKLQLKKKKLLDVGMALRTEIRQAAGGYRLLKKVKRD